MECKDKYTKDKYALLVRDTCVCTYVCMRVFCNVDFILLCIETQMSSGTSSLLNHESAGNNKQFHID